MAHLGKLEGQISAVMLLMQAHHESINQRINDMQKAVEQRVDNVESRVDRVEKRVDAVEDKERSSAIKAASGGAIAAAAIEAIKFFVGR